MLVYDGIKSSFIEDVDLNVIADKIYEKYRTYFDREIIDSFKDKFETVNFNYQKQLNYNFKYKWYELDNNIILKYLDLLNNIEKKNILIFSKFIL